MKTTSVTRRTMVRGLTAGLAAACICPAQNTAAPGSIEKMRIGESDLEIAITGAQLDLPQTDILHWVNECATAVARYFGRFPVSKARLMVAAREGRQGVSGGRTWGDRGARTRISVGQHTTVAGLKRDWVLTHEFTHYAFPDMPEGHSWIEEGLATYIEPIARVGVGNLTPGAAWFDMVRDMPQGQPKAGDEGLDHTHTWGRTYWGGAMFCLLADIAIRKNTKNTKGLRDALRGILADGGSIEVEWPIERALQTADKAVGGTALMSLYDQMSSKAVPVDLATVWKELGIEIQGDAAAFVDTAPLAAIRKSIMA